MEPALAALGTWGLLEAGWRPLSILAGPRGMVCGAPVGDRRVHVHEEVEGLPHFAERVHELEQPPEAHVPVEVVRREDEEGDEEASVGAQSCTV